MDDPEGADDDGVVHDPRDELGGPGPVERAGPGWLDWEATRPSTGEVVARGRREVRAGEFEVMITPARPAPALSRLRLGPRQVAADLVSWVLTRGRARTVKRLRLGGGFWLALHEQPGPAVPTGMALQTSRDGESLFSWDWFETGDGGATATKLQETGALALEWFLNRDGTREVASTSFTTDVSLRLRADGERDHRRPAYRVRVLAGSVVRWPRAADGVRLVPRLRPDHPGRRPGD